MSSLCLDKVTGSFPEFSLTNAEKDIGEHYQKYGKGSDGTLPRLPGKVGGETDIMIGIKYLKYFPKEIHKLPNGLTIYEAMFKNSDGSLEVVAGPHQSFSIDWDKMGQVAYSYDVMPEVTQSQYIPENGMEVPLRGWGKNLEKRVMIRIPRLLRLQVTSPPVALLQIKLTSWRVRVRNQCPGIKPARNALSVKNANLPNAVALRRCLF